MPVSGLVLFCLPGVVLTDAVLQGLYKPVATTVEQSVHNGKEMARLLWVMNRLMVRSSYRLARAQLRKARADPKQVVQDMIAMVWDVATHPVQTAEAAWGLAKTGISGVWSLCSMVKASMTAGVVVPVAQGGRSS